MTHHEPAALPGRLITFEGVDGSGKSTQLAALAETFEGRGVSVVATREPGGTPLGEAIRGIVLDPTYTGMAPRAELLLYLAARAEHVERVIRPALRRGDVVLCDRFTDATLAYQVSGRGLRLRDVTASTAFAADGLEPDLVILLDLPVQDGLSRVRARRDANRLDREGLAFHQRVRDGYLALAAEHPARYRVFDASKPERQLRREILDAVERSQAPRPSGERV